MKRQYRISDAEYKLISYMRSMDVFETKSLHDMLNNKSRSNPEIQKLCTHIKEIYSEKKEKVLMKIKK